MPENRTLSAEIIGGAIDLTSVSRAMLLIVIVAAAGFFFGSSISSSSPTRCLRSEANSTSTLSNTQPMTSRRYADR